ncbi:MAG: hypothetical protein IJN52_00025 [Bacteroidales bacterium]|nr:hypothetical protein [Bacteroidales bacterium]
MKKFFSAILLMTMMVFSVGTFVSCNDLVDEMQGIQGQVDGQQAAIKALNDEIAVLESALATAQSTADAAKKAADDAAAAAAQAKADAIADAKAQVEALKSAYEGKIAEIEATLAGKVSKEELDAAVKAASDGVNAALEVINTKLATIEATIKDLQDKKADKAELDAEVAKLLEADTKINTQLAALENYIKNLEVGGSANASQIDSIRTELANAAAEIEDLWAFLQDENTGLYALVAGNSSAITAMQEDFQAALDELYADIYGEGPNSLFTMVGQHAGLIQDLDERMTAAEEAILANNQALSIAVKIANQIQSVVYVPTSDNIPSMSYYLGATTLKKYESPLMIMATYEVSPKALVETLEDVNVGFATVATKVAGAEYFGAKIIDRDATTGRMIVVGYITKGSDAYKVLTGANTQNGVSFNLNVSVSAPFNVEDEDGLQASIDGGTFVVSDYTKATVAGAAKNLAENVYTAYPYGDVVAYNTVFSASYEVPYSPVGDSSARSLFEQFMGLYVNFEGTYLPLDRASEVLGFDLVPSYGAFKATYNAADNNYDGKKESPIVVSGENFATVATLAGPTGDYKKEADAIGQNVVVKVDGVKLNDTAVDVTIQSTYKVGYKKADITLTSADFVWSYQYGAELDGVYNDPDNEFPLLKSAAELDVTSGTADISALYVGDPLDPTSQQFSPNNVIEFESTAKDSKGNEYDATIQVVSLSKDNVRIVGGNVPFAPGEELTYKFNAILYDKARVQYTLEFSFTTTPMPANKEIVLDPVAVDVKFNYDMVAPVTPIDAILAVDAAYYPEAAAGLASFEALSDAFIAGTGALNVYDPNTPAADQSIFDFTVANYKAYNAWSQLTAVYDASYVTIEDAVIGDEFVFIYEYTVFDVVYTIVVPAEVVKATGYALEVNPLLVNSNNVVNLTKGTVKYPTVATGSTSVTAGTDYELEVIDLRDYVMVTGEDQYDLAAEELALSYTVTNYYKDNAGTEYVGEAWATIDNAYTNTIVGTVDELVNQLTWGLDTLGQYVNTMTVKIDLVANNALKGDPKKRTLYGSQTLTLVVPELLEATAIKPVYDSKKASNCKGAYSIMEANTTTGALEWTPVNAVKGVKVTAKDTKKTALYNPYAADLTELWMDYNSSTKTTIAGGDDVFAVYNQTTATVATKWNGYAYVLDVTAKFQSSGKAVPADYYTVDVEGNVALTVNSGEITDNIIVTVPVVFKHDYCSSEHKVNVEVLFVK